MIDKTINKENTRYQNTHFFRKLLLTEPIIITQKYNLASFLAGQLAYKKFRKDYNSQNLATAITGHREDFLQPDNQKLLKGRDLFIIEPWFSLEDIFRICRYAKSVFFASSFHSHFEEVRMYQRYLPDNLNLFLSTKEELIEPINRVYFDEQEKPRLFAKWLKAIQRSDITSYDRIMLETNASSHEHFYQTFDSFDDADSLHNVPGGEDFDMSAMSFMYDNIANESFAVYSKKQDLKVLYMAAKLYEAPQYDVFLRKAISSESTENSCIANVLVTFTVTSTMMFYTVTRLDGDTNILQTFAKHKPVGNEHRAFIIKPLSVLNTGLVLKL